MKTVVSMAACVFVGLILLAASHYALATDNYFVEKRFVGVCLGGGLLLIGYGVWGLIDEFRGN